MPFDRPIATMRGDIVASGAFAAGAEALVTTNDGSVLHISAEGVRATVLVPDAEGRPKFAPKPGPAKPLVRGLRLRDQAP